MKRYIKSSENSSTRNYSVSEWDLINDKSAKVRWEVANNTNDPDILSNDRVIVED
jgi:hypothetical protein